VETTIKAATVYFKQKGKQNTEEVLGTVTQRLKRGDIEAVVAATSTGQTALQAARALPKGTRLIAANFQSAHWDKYVRPDPEIQREAEELGAVFMPETPVARYLDDVPGQAPGSFRRLGEGVKVAVEVVMQAVEVGLIPSGAKVIGIGGTSKGADVALVIRSAGPDEMSRLWVSEILAKPI
jgi:hypothetical protein